MAKSGSGKIVVTCKTNVAGKVVEQIVKDFGLEFGKVCVSGDFYFITVPKGTEVRWANAFRGQPEVTGAGPVPVYSR
ncbi:MAG: hypothetical protein HYT93_01140 [Parcubacteria group bacterium]|nr:hypothetical protein [Parcubacteria group bacterium]